MLWSHLRTEKCRNIFIKWVWMTLSLYHDGQLYECTLKYMPPNVPSQQWCPLTFLTHIWLLGCGQNYYNPWSLLHENCTFSWLSNPVTLVIWWLSGGTTACDWLVTASDLNYATHKQLAWTLCQFLAFTDSGYWTYPSGDSETDPWPFCLSSSKWGHLRHLLVSSWVILQLVCVRSDGNFELLHELLKRL